MRIVAFITEQNVIDRILDHLRRKGSEQRALLLDEQAGRIPKPRREKPFLSAFSEASATMRPRPVYASMNADHAAHGLLEFAWQKVAP